jgi:hypothetical protein
LPYREADHWTADLPTTQRTGYDTEGTLTGYLDHSEFIGKVGPMKWPTASMICGEPPR